MSSLPPRSSIWSTLGPLYPALLLSQLPAGWACGGMVCVVTRDTESGLQWNVSPGRVSDPRGGVKIAQAKTASEGGRQRLRYWGWGEGGNPVYTNPRSLCWLKQLLLVFVSSQDLPQLPWDALICQEGVEGSSPWALCLLPLGWCTCQALPLSEALGEVKAATVFLACESTLQLSLNKLDPSQ